MKALISCIFCLTLLTVPGLAHGNFPVHLGGLTLGDDIANYHHLINMETCREVTFNEYIAEGEIFTPPGFKSGLVAYGLCDRPNKILRIKLKYENSSKRFFNQLLKEYKKQLGDPTEYKGDPFQTLIAWKWSFSNKDNETISLILQHNVMVADEKIGTAVKMTLTSQLEKERACYMANPPEPEKKRMNNAPQLTKKEMWRLFVPY